MDNAPAISDAEWQVMQVLWDRSPRTANDVVDALAPLTDWHPRTVKTMLNRLVKKQALGFTVDGNRYLYRPRVTRQACMGREIGSLKQRLFDGATAPMLAYLVRHHRLSADEIDQLKRILDEQGD